MLKPEEPFFRRPCTSLRMAVMMHHDAVATRKNVSRSFAVCPLPQQDTHFTQLEANFLRLFMCNFEPKKRRKYWRPHFFICERLEDIQFYTLHARLKRSHMTWFKFYRMRLLVLQFPYNSLHWDKLSKGSMDLVSRNKYIYRKGLLKEHDIFY
jgi:hypothetical protein